MPRTAAFLLGLEGLTGAPPWPASILAHTVSKKDQPRARPALAPPRDLYSPGRRNASVRITLSTSAPWSDHSKAARSRAIWTVATIAPSGVRPVVGPKVSRMGETWIGVELGTYRRPMRSPLAYFSTAAKTLRVRE